MQYLGLDKLSERFPSISWLVNSSGKRKQTHCPARGVGALQMWYEIPLSTNKFELLHGTIVTTALNSLARSGAANPVKARAACRGFGLVTWNSA